MHRETIGNRADRLIRLLDLQPHPEGGHYRRIFASATPVSTLDDRGHRPALTAIHYLLRAGEHSAWHRVRSDEAWQHHEGAPLTLFLLDPGLREPWTLHLGPAGRECRPAAVVPAGWWQAATVTGDYALAGCCVGPGFDFADFELLRERPGDADRLRRRHPQLDRWL